MSSLVTVIVDGLPPSNSADKLIALCRSRSECVSYVNFTDTVLGKHPTQEIVNYLTEKLAKTQTAQIRIIAVSFGAYVVLHSSKLLENLKDRLESVTAYSPPTRLRKVVGIDTLPEHLSKTYNLFTTTLQGLLSLDDVFSSRQLLKDNLLSKTKIVYGLEDRQVLASDIETYYAGFTLKGIKEDHLDINYIIKEQSWA